MSRDLMIAFVFGAVLALIVALSLSSHSSNPCNNYLGQSAQDYQNCMDERRNLP